MTAVSSSRIGPRETSLPCHACPDPEYPRMPSRSSITLLSFGLGVCVSIMLAAGTDVAERSLIAGDGVGLSIGVFATALVTAVGITWVIAVKWTRVEMNTKLNRERLSRLEARLQQAGIDEPKLDALGRKMDWQNET